MKTNGSPKGRYARTTIGNRGPWHVVVRDEAGVLQTACRRSLRVTQAEHRATDPGELALCVDCRPALS